MLTRIEFQNWRSLQSAVLDGLTPITVLIGANSSGKTNIVDGLRFMRFLNSEGQRYRTLSSIPIQWGGWDVLRTVGAVTGQPTRLDAMFAVSQIEGPITQSHEFRFKTVDENPAFLLTTNFPVDETVILEKPGSGEYIKAKFARADKASDLARAFVGLRWQILGEYSAPGLRVSEKSSSADVFQLAENAEYLAYVLDHLRRTEPAAFAQLQEDAAWLMAHVAKVETERVDRELQVLLTDPVLGSASPTVSAGTSRLLAILAAHYSLAADRTPIAGASLPGIFASDLPGLIVAEEADASLNPGLLERFVGLLRTYTEGVPPHQFILTTHNPAFLNFFEPHEVRVVRRDAAGHTQIAPVPEDIVRIWGDAYRLGDIWTTNVFGGLPE